MRLGHRFAVPGEEGVGGGGLGDSPVTGGPGHAGVTLHDRDENDFHRWTHLRPHHHRSGLFGRGTGLSGERQPIWDKGKDKWLNNYQFIRLYS